MGTGLRVLTWCVCSACGLTLRKTPAGHKGTARVFTEPRVSFPVGRTSEPVSHLSSPAPLRGAGLDGFGWGGCTEPPSTSQPRLAPWNGGPVAGFGNDYALTAPPAVVAVVAVPFLGRVPLPSPTEDPSGRIPPCTTDGVCPAYVADSSGSPEVAGTPVVYMDRLGMCPGTEGR